MFYQDTHLSDVGNWDNVKDDWRTSSYGDLISELQSVNLNNKKIDADLFNTITELLTYVQGLNDPTFKQNNIKVSTTPPSTLQDGGVYFRLD